jgi:hypothetical protein
MKRLIATLPAGLAASELAGFRKKHGYTFPIAPDPNREAYSKYATRYIPRNVLVDTAGRITFQSVGYEPRDFEDLLKAIQQALDSPG